jgi:WD40 repeat protein
VGLFELMVSVKNTRKVSSFTAMHLTVSPLHSEPRYLLVSTDQPTGRRILFRLHSDRQVQNFYGVRNDGFSQPRHAWLPDGSHFYATSEDDNSVWVFRVSDGQVVRKLGGVDALDGYSGDGHHSTVRDLVFDEKKGCLLTASYDQTIGIWQ